MHKGEFKICESCKKVEIVWPKIKWCDDCAKVNHIQSSEVRKMAKRQEARKKSSRSNCAECNKDIMDRDPKSKYCVACSKERRDARLDKKNAAEKEATRLRRLAKVRLCESCKKVELEWPRTRWCVDCSGVDGLKNASERHREKIKERNEWLATQKSEPPRMCKRCETNIEHLGIYHRYCPTCSVALANEREQQRLEDAREKTAEERRSRGNCVKCKKRPIGIHRIKYCDKCGLEPQKFGTTYAPPPIQIMNPTPRRPESKKIKGYYPIEYEEDETNPYAKVGDVF